MKRVLATLLALSAPVQAQVSSTAAPVANSSGSVTNQAVQVVPSRQFTNTYGGGISCQGATLNINPFVSTTTGWADPYEATYADPVFDTLDIVGAFDSEGMPSQMAGPIIRALSLSINQLEQVKKQISQLMAGLQQQFQCLWIAHTSEHVEQQQKNKSRY